MRYLVTFSLNTFWLKVIQCWSDSFFNSFSIKTPHDSNNLDTCLVTTKIILFQNVLRLRNIIMNLRIAMQNNSNAIVSCCIRQCLKEIGTIKRFYSVYGVYYVLLHFIQSSVITKCGFIPEKRS